MHPVNSAEYQAAVEEAANAFMKVMALRGFAVRDYPQNFVAHMAQQARLHFEISRAGAHPDAAPPRCLNPRLTVQTHFRPALAGRCCLWGG